MNSSQATIIDQVRPPTSTRGGFTYENTRSSRKGIWMISRGCVCKIARRPYNKLMSAYRQRIREDFPRQVYHSLLSQLHQGWKWGSHSSQYNLPNLWEQRGYGNIKYKSYEADHILNFLQFARQMKQGKIWERGGRVSYTYYNTRSELFEHAFDVIHSVEAFQSWKLFYNQGEVREQSICNIEDRIRKKRACLGYTHPGNISRDRKVAEAERVLKVCKLLRKMARSDKVSIPKPPVKPMTPTMRLREKARKRKLRTATKKREKRETIAKAKFAATIPPPTIHYHV